MVKEYHWENWSGSQSADFKSIVSPKTEEDIVEAVLNFEAKKLPFKIMGSSHSFSHLIADSNSHLLSLDHLRGIKDLNPNVQTVTAAAGTTIKELSRELWERGWALENLGDIEEQALAGAISTGTHGTGLNYQNLAGFVEELTLVSPKRGVETYRRNHPDFCHLAVGTGSFGVVLSYKLRIVPKYFLKLDLFPENLDSFRELLPSWLKANRNTEVFWFPGTDALLVKLTNETRTEVIKNRKSEWIADYLENKAFGFLAKINKTYPSSHAMLRGILKRLLPTSTKIDRSYKVYATERKIKFQETEYSIPISKLWEVFEQLKDLVSRGRYPTLFPIEFRFVKRDDLSLSPSYGEEDRVYIAVHTYFQDRFYPDYFKEAEKIFLSASGRPHWGKMFFCHHESFAAMYPKLPEVKSFRKTFDPEGLLLTTTLAECLYK